MLPYLVVSAFLVMVIMLVSNWHFGVAFYQLPALAMVCLLFLLCSLGLGLLISAFLAHANPGDSVLCFLSAAGICALRRVRATSNNYHQAIRYISELFPLTHFCRAFRLVNMYRAGPQFYIGDLLVLLAGALITFVGAAIPAATN